MTKEEQDKLIVDTMPDAKAFALSLLKHFGVRIPRPDVDDLVGEAYLVLTEAARKFDPNHPHTTFKAYFYRMLRNAIMDWCNRRTVLYFPAGIRRNQNGRLTNNEYLLKLLKKSKTYFELDENMPDDSEEKMNEAILLQDVLGVVSKMGDTERRLLERYFGINGSEKDTLDTLANEIGITREAVRCRIRKSINHICNKLSSPHPKGRRGVRFTFSHDKVCKIFPQLTKHQQEVAGAYYGIHQERQSIEQIAARKGVIPSEVTSRLDEAHKSIGRLLTREALVDADV